MSTTTTTPPAPAVVPVCPWWCQVETDAHKPMSDDDGPGFVHIHETSEPDAPVCVRVEAWQGSDGLQTPAVYVEDAHGDVLTAEQARAAALALVAAADLLDAGQAVEQ
mgnify:CR=1 FL=1